MRGQEGGQRQPGLGSGGGGAVGVALPDGSGPDHVLIVLSAEIGLHSDLHRLVGFRQLLGHWRTMGQERSECPGAVMTLKSGRIGCSFPAGQTEVHSEATWHIYKSVVRALLGFGPSCEPGAEGFPGQTPGDGQACLTLPCLWGVWFPAS